MGSVENKFGIYQSNLFQLALGVSFTVAFKLACLFSGLSSPTVRVGASSVPFNRFKFERISFADFGRGVRSGGCLGGGIGLASGYLVSELFSNDSNAAHREATLVGAAVTLLVYVAMGAQPMFEKFPLTQLPQNAWSFHHGFFDGTVGMTALVCGLVIWKRGGLNGEG